ncbi:MAG TPA: hypothetical protein VI322_04630 [Candidatus Saccharimonadia bacterium]
MELKLDRISRQLQKQNLLLQQLERLMRQQSDTANRRCDATFKTLGDGFRNLNRRLDQHELVFEAIDDQLRDDDAPPSFASALPMR